MLSDRRSLDIHNARMPGLGKRVKVSVERVKHDQNQRYKGGLQSRAVSRLGYLYTLLYGLNTEVQYTQRGRGLEGGTITYHPLLPHCSRGFHWDSPPSTSDDPPLALVLDRTSVGWKGR